MKLKTAQRICSELDRDIFSGLIGARVFFTRARNDHGQSNHSGIAINPRNISGIAQLTETLYHELVHLYLDDILEVKDNFDHGFYFWSWYYALLPAHIEPDFTGIH